MKKIRILKILIVGAILSAPAYARDCELPHEWLSAECNQAEAISGVQKKKDAGQIVADYKERAKTYEAVVAKAEEDYQNYRSKRRR